MTTQSLKERREERERKARELRARIQRIRELNIAKQFVNNQPEIIQASDTPAIPSATQQQVTSDLAKQRTAFTPIGEVSVGDESAARETRGKPEFGSGFGSGVLENIVGGVLPALENVQKGIETTMGGVTSTASSLIPGVDLMGIEANLAEERAKRGVESRLPDFLQASPARLLETILSGNPAGEMQAQAAAFRNTDMPSTQISLPGQGIPLPGGRKIDDIDIGVKGALELVPEIALGVATAGTSTGASIARKTATSTLNALGKDVITGGFKATSKASRSTINAAKKAPEVAGRTRAVGSTSYDLIESQIDRLADAGVRETIKSLPVKEFLKGPILSTVSAISPIRAADTSRAAVKAIYVYAKGIDQSQKMADLSNADFLKRLQGAGMKLPKVVESLDPNYVRQAGDPSFAIGPGGQIGHTGIPSIDRGQIISTKTDKVTGAKIHKRVPYTYSEVFENFFVNNKRVPKRFEKDSEEYWNHIFERSDVRGAYGNADIGIWGDAVQKYVRDPNKVNAVFDQDAADLATWIRHWQDQVEAIKLEYLNQGGKFAKGEKALHLDFISSRYSPRNPTGTLVHDDIHVVNGTQRSSTSGRAPGSPARATRQRTLESSELRDRVDRGELSLLTPMETLSEHARSMHKAGFDIQHKRAMKAAARKAGSGVIDLVDLKARSRRAAQSILKAKNTDSFSEVKIAELEAAGLEGTANVLREANKAGLNTKRRANIVAKVKAVLKEDVYTLSDGMWMPTRKGAVTAATTQEGKTAARVSSTDRLPAYTGLLFENKKEVDRLVNLHFPNEEINTLRGFTKNLAEVGDIIRLGRTGFDLGFWMIQGLPTLGLAAAKMVTSPTVGTKLMKAWVTSYVKATEAMFSQDRMMLSLADDLEYVTEFVQNGGQISRSSTDAFQALQSGTILRKLPKVGDKVDPGLTKLASPFERAFVAPGDYIRIQFYKAMRESAILKADSKADGLQDLSASLNNMTGALSSSAMGLNPTLQDIERGILFFSPRYTRASMALLADVFKGGVSGSAARQSMAGMVGLGAMSYYAMVNAINAAGGNQELHLDPSKSTFMTFDIGDDKIGFGGFWTQFAKLSSQLAETAWDEDARQKFLDMESKTDVARTNPLIRWMRSRAAPGAGVFWDAGLGEDFLGRDIEGVADWTQHVGRQTLPIWIEAAVLKDPYGTGKLGTVLEFGGARVRPLSASERRRDLRDSIAIDVYGKEWVELNGLQRSRVSNGEVDGISQSDVESLQVLSDEVLAGNVARGEEEDLVIEKYHNRHIKIEDSWNKQVQEGVEALGSGLIDLKDFRDMYLSSSNNVRRSRLEELNDEEGEYALAIQHFQENAERFGEERPEDVAYNQYVTNIIATDAFDDPRGFDFEARDSEVKKFQQTWGDEVFAYVQERFRVGRDIPVLVNEFWQGRKRFEYFWKDIDETTLATMPNSSALEATYTKWKRATDNEKFIIEEETPFLKAFLQKVSNVKRALRERDQQLDAWLFRWGYYDTLVHPDNKFSPDGMDDAREYWRMPRDMPLFTFGIQDGVAT